MSSAPRGRVPPGAEGSAQRSVNKLEETHHAAPKSTNELSKGTNKVNINFNIKIKRTKYKVSGWSEA